jgi:crotonobetainyl-CoA:carnitine CoA-transferase CaiB-like acyl-CoA transferase
VAGSDVLVENLKPGALRAARTRAGRAALINPRLVYCAISGFGADSAYPGRPAFDTVVQAMSGIMDLTRVNGVPQKTGISLADVLGGVFGLIATLGALIARDASGAGEQIDISMQDAAAWVTQWCWRTGYPEPGCVTVACSDGHVVAMLPAATASRAKARSWWRRRPRPRALRSSQRSPRGTLPPRPC